MKSSQTVAQIQQAFSPYIEKATRINGALIVGYGHANNPHISDGTFITPDIADQFLAHDIHTAEEIVKKAISVDLNQTQFDSLVSFVLTCPDPSSIFARANNGTLGDGTHFLIYTKHGVIDQVTMTERRKTERLLWGSPCADDHDTGA